MVAFEAVRAIAEGAGWRIDFAPRIAGAWLPWEPVSTETFASKALARRALRAYAAAMPSEG